MKKVVLFIAISFFAIELQSCKKKGCTNASASNFDPKAKKDDGSCILSSVAAGAALDDIDSPTTLVNTSAEVDYFINEEVYVSSSLTIEPGVVIVCSNAGGLYINGNSASLNCNGTAALPIVFRSSNGIAGSWKGIWFEGSNNVNNVLNYTEIRDGGAGSFNGNESLTGNVQAYGTSQLRINHSLFSNSASVGFRTGVFSTTTFAQFSSNSFINNANSPMIITDNMVHTLDGTATTFSGNGNQYIEINTNDFTGVGGDRVWKKQNIPYAFFNVGDDLVCGYYTTHGSLTLQAGVTLLMGPGSKIVVGDNSNTTGFLKCEGTAAEPVTISGVDATPGAWVGILISTNSIQNNWTYTNVSYGGSATLSGSTSNLCNVLIGENGSDDSNLTISNCTTNYSLSCGYTVFSGGAGNNSLSGFFSGNGNATALNCP
jgi:hypothetical protein